MATRSPLPASTWRSTQWEATLSSPSWNHLANGGFDQSSVSVGSLAQVSRRACSAQKPSLSALALSYASAVTLALAARSAGGAKRRSSFNRLEREELSLIVPSPPSQGWPGFRCSRHLPFPGVSVVSQATAHQNRGCHDKGRRQNGLDLLRWSDASAAEGSPVPTDAGARRFMVCNASHTGRDPSPGRSAARTR